MERLLHTPEGVRDIYNDECEKKLKLQSKIHNAIRKYGYRDIETPTFEFFDVFNRAVGSVTSREMYKFFDREGNTLVLRPDITPSIARAVSKYFVSSNEEIRLCYEGNTFINNSSYQGRLKETTQIGAEFIGSDTAYADAEMIAIVADCLKSSGLKEFQISIGQVEYFKSIISDLDISEETELELKDFISNRNMIGVESLIEQLGIEGPAKEALMALPELYGSVDVLDRAISIAPNEMAVNSVKRLKAVFSIIELYGITEYVSFDFSMLSRYNYYTGIFFRGYTFGSGDAVVKGGRYNNLLKVFGTDAPSIGFVVVVDELLAALTSQKLDSFEKDKIQELYFNESCEEQVIRLANRLRIEGQYAVLHYESEDQDKIRKTLELCRE